MSPSGTTGVFTTDLSLVVRSWDSWLADATGIPEADACGRAIAELVPDLRSRGLLARLERVATTGGVEVLAPAFHEYLIPCAPRRASSHFARMQQHVTMAPLRAGGLMVGVEVTIHDVTARRDRERELAARLQSADEGVRLQAVRALDAEGGPVRGDAFGIDPLANALGDASWRVRRAAAESLARADDDAATEALLDAVRERHRDPAVLNAALTALRHSAHDVVVPLVALLRAPTSDADVRTYVALALGLLEDGRAVPALVAALDDPDANVRYHAIEALGRIGSRAAAAAVARVAETRDFAVAFAALDTLALIGEPSVAPRLVPLLDDDLLSPAAADALGRLGDEDVVEPLAAALARPGAPAGALALALARLHERLGDGADDSRVARRARRALAPRAAAALDHLVAELEPAGDDERHGIVVALGWLEGDAVVPALARALAWPRARRLAAELLARRGTAAVAPLLEALATADDDELRKATAAALGRIGAAAAVPTLVDLLDAPPELAVVAAGALGGIGDRAAFEPLLAHLDHPQAAVRQAVVAALCSIGHPDMPGRLGELLAAESPRVREGGAKIAGYFGDSASLGPMLALASDPDESVRRTAVEQLAYFDDARATAALGEALAHGPPSVRAAAARSLTHADTAAALAGLQAACRDSDPWVRYYAARSAGHLGVQGLVSSLIALATWDAVPPVRIAAVEALVELGDRTGIEAVVPLAHDPDPTVRRAALLALGKLDDDVSLAPLVAALEGEDRECRVAALGALGERGRSGVGVGPEWGQSGVRVDDPKSLISHHPDRASSSEPLPTPSSPVPTIARLARADDDADVRSAAVRTLARIGGEAAVAALVALAGEPRHAEAAVAALAGMDAGQAEWIARGLQHPDVATRCAVVEALSRLRAGAHEGAVARALARALDDDAEVVRLAAARALERLDLRAAEGDEGDEGDEGGAGGAGHGATGRAR